ncbi:MAG: hypothetical protein JWQ76_4212 [Ramlibacter sp.]|nr:hypothetical protein [Ramlibacter sp.]
MSAEAKPTRIARLTGAVVAFVGFACALAALLAVLDAQGASKSTVVYVGKLFTYSGFGIVFIGWRWPGAVLRPFNRLIPRSVRFNSSQTHLGAARALPSGGVEGQLLRSPLQRGLIVLGCISLVPWIFMRAVREIGRSSDISDYLRSVLVAPLSPWFESGWWWYTKLEWYDWPVLPALVAFVLAFAWPYTGAHVIAWVRGRQ